MSVTDTDSDTADTDRQSPTISNRNYDSFSATPTACDNIHLAEVPEMSDPIAAVEYPHFTILVNSSNFHLLYFPMGRKHLHPLAS